MIVKATLPGGVRGEQAQDDVVQRADHRRVAGVARLKKQRALLRET